MTAHLTAQAVTRRYGASAVVDGVSLDLEPGKITALLGGSGAPNFWPLAHWPLCLNQASASIASGPMSARPSETFAV